MTDCNCELCQIAHVLEALKPRCTPEENRLLAVLWDRMEYAELSLWDQVTRHKLAGADQAPF